MEVYVILIKFKTEIVQLQPNIAVMLKHKNMCYKARKFNMLCL